MKREIALLSLRLGSRKIVIFVHYSIVWDSICLFSAVVAAFFSHEFGLEGICFSDSLSNDN